MNMMAACGLNCETCEIRLARFDPQAADGLVNWLKSEGWLAADEGMPQVIERKLFCTGCLGSRGTHWSADCWILTCCVDRHSLSNCSQCHEFPCARLVAWSEQNESYRQAFNTLSKR
jgi:hypothetical protein